MNIRDGLEDISVIERFFDRANSIILILNSEMEIKYLNPFGHELLEYEKDELIGKKWVEIITPPTARKQISEEFYNTVKDNAKVLEFYECPILTKNGKEKFIAWQNSIIKDKGDKIIATLSFGDDITEEKYLRRNLEKEKERFKKIAEISPIGIILFDKDGKITYSNKKTEEILGVPSTKIQSTAYNAPQVKTSDFNGNPVRDEDFPFRQVQNKMKPIYNDEKAVEFSDGKKIFISMNASPIIDDSGQFDGAVVTVLDISEQKKVQKDLIDSEIKFRNIAERSIFGIIIMQDNEYKYVNQRFAEITGYSVKEMLEWGPSEFMATVHPEDRETIIKNLKARDEGKSEEHHYTFRGFKKSGEPIWGELYSKPISFQDRQAILITIADITEKRRTEEALKESEAKFRIMAEQSILGILILQDGQFKYVNQRFVEMSGYSAEEILEWGPLQFLDTIHPDDKEYVTKNAKARQDSKDFSEHHYSFRSFKKSGELVWSEIRSKPIIYEGKEATMITSTDITEKKRAEQRLMESEEKFRTIAEQSMFGILIIQDDKFKYMNRKFIKITKDIDSDIIGKGLADFLERLIPEEKERIHKIIKSRKNGTNTEELHYNLQGLNKMGEQVWLEVYSKPILYESKAATMITLADITEKKKAELLLKESEVKYKQAFNRAEFYKDIFAHDINNILQNIRSANDLIGILKDQPEKEDKIVEFIEIINAQIQRGANLVSNVRKLSKLEEIDTPLKKIDAQKILDEAIASIKSTIFDKHIQIQVKNDIENIQLNADDFLLDVFENILINAINYNNSKIVNLTIKISKIKKDELNYFQLEFEDNGIGIQDDRKKAIFERGYEKGVQGKGMGLGLSLVKKIIDHYNGNIWVEDRVPGDYSKGSKFIIQIPEAFKHD